MHPRHRVAIRLAKKLETHSFWNASQNDASGSFSALFSANRFSLMFWNSFSIHGYARFCVRSWMVALITAMIITRVSASAPLVGTLPGNLTVNNRGLPNYRVPLPSVSGRAGLEPIISIIYDGRTDNDIAGVGCFVDIGFPQAIVRGRSILARDSIVQGVKFNNDDKFYLDGKRLVSTEGSYGYPGSFYRCEVDSFLDIEATGVSGIDTFIARDKSGNVFVFGKSAGSSDGFQKAAGEANDIAYRYALKRVEDAAGNYLIINYSEPNDGEHLINDIIYTGGAGGPPAAKVVFEYEVNPDQNHRYVYGRRNVSTRRLASVVAKTLLGGDWVTVSRYDLGYSYSTQLKRSRLDAINPLLAKNPGAELDPCAPITLRWGDLPQRYSSPGDFYAPATISFPRTGSQLAGDFNGDGREDVLFCEASSLFGGATGTVAVASRTHGGGAWVHQQYTLSGFIAGMRLVTAGDLNGDGASDIVLMKTGKGSQGGGWYVSFSTASGFQAIQLLSSNHEDPLKNKCNAGSALVADLDGDGIEELIFQDRVTPTSGALGWLSQPVIFEEGDLIGFTQSQVGMSIGVPGGVFKMIRPRWVSGQLQFAESTLPTLPSWGAIARTDLDGDGRSDFLVTFVSMDPLEPAILNFSTETRAYLNVGNDTFSAQETALAGGGLIPLAGLPFAYHHLIGDVNGDGLDDVIYLRVVPGEMEEGWLVALSKGDGGFEHQAFAGVPAQVSVNGGAVRTYYQNSGSFVVGVHNSGEGDTYSLDDVSGYTIQGVLLADYNGDGRKDFIWHSTAHGWLCFLAGSSGFDVATAISVIDKNEDDTDYYDEKTIGVYDFGLRVRPFASGDSDRDSLLLTSGWAVTLAESGLNVAYRLSEIKSGLGDKTEIAYAPLSSYEVYTRGVEMVYPIQEKPDGMVVAHVDRDSGAGGESQRFSYQYSGARTDLSGRGFLGFQSFVTLDHQTKLFKYQFLTQSFPMTGLTAREQTYRYWESGTGPSTAVNFRLISSHDNTVVFDKVVDGPDGDAFGTVYPFVSKAVQSRWEDSATAHYTWTKSNPAGGAESSPESIFPATRPTGAHITITAKSWFDEQSHSEEPQTAIAGSYQASDTSSSGANVVVGTPSYATFSALSLPGKITYGNLRKLETDFGDEFKEAVVTTYHEPTSNGLTGLVDTINTSVTSPNYSTEAAPEKSFTYWSNGAIPTPLVETETINASGTELDLTTTYTRDTRGRVTATQISGYANAGPEGATVLGSLSAGKEQHIGTFDTSSVEAFDDRFDLPTLAKNAYDHPTTTVYHPFFALPTSVTDANGAEVTTQYDALARVVQTRDELKDLQTDTSYVWTDPEAEDWTATQTVVSPLAEGVALTLSSVYAVRVTTSGAPPVTSYHDRLGRVIRTRKEGFAGQVTLADTLYNKLGQVVAVSLPYLENGTRYWTQTTYDDLGRVKTITAPNGTVTTNTYNGRVTQVTVDAPDREPQTNTTLVDAKGRTVKVWNADNVPTTLNAITGSTMVASIAFDLDGFGRMRQTTLKDQTQVITAAYDDHGRQTQLADPDKGTWNYVNNALGHVVKQTDAKNSVTRSTFDRLGRQLARQTIEAGENAPTETASWHYYDSTADPFTHRVALGTKGWIGAVQREESSTTNTPGYNAGDTKTVHYYDEVGRPEIALTQIDGKWFYRQTNYDSLSRVETVTHYWRPAEHENPADLPYLWRDWGYTYTYDAESYVLAITDSQNRTWWEADGADGYDLLDRPVLMRKGEGHWTRRTFAPLTGLLTNLVTGSLAGTTLTPLIQDLSFGYDGLGNLNARGDALLSRSETYGYDGLNRLTHRGTDPIATYYDNGNIKTKVDVAGDVSPSDYVYSATKPHAVTSAWGHSMDYDGNGNLLTRTKGSEAWSLKWAGFDKPRWMAKIDSANSTTEGSEFHYNANRSRTVHLNFDAMSGGAPSHYTRKKLYAAGAAMEVDYVNEAASGAAQWKMATVRLYVPAPEGTAGTMEFDQTAQFIQTPKALVYHHDHLGSVQAITPHGATDSSFALDDNGKPSRYSYEAWGQRRDPADWAGAPAITANGGADDASPRGFTGHEMMDDLGLVHMNGRIYDPLLGRFLSADIVVQAPGNLQAYNRYSYVMNNPVTYTDPTGFFWDPDSGWWSASEWGIFGKAAVVDPAVEGYKSGSLSMEKGFTEWDNAKNSTTPGLDRTLAVLHMVSGTGEAVGIVSDYVPGAKQVKGTATVLAKNVDEIAEGASKLTKALAKNTDEAAGGAAKLEKRLDDMANKADEGTKAGKVEAAVQRNAKDGARRETEVTAELKNEGGGEILEQRTIYDSDGTRAIAADGKGRRLDHVRVEDGKATQVVETTSPTEALRGRKLDQVARGDELIKREGTYIKDSAGNKIPFADDLETELRKKK